MKQRKRPIYSPRKMAISVKNGARGSRKIPNRASASKPIFQLSDASYRHYWGSSRQVKVRPGLRCWDNRKTARYHCYSQPRHSAILKMISEVVSILKNDKNLFPASDVHVSSPKVPLASPIGKVKVETSHRAVQDVLIEYVIISSKLIFVLPIVW